MKELYLAKIKSIKGGIEPYMETISNLIQEKDERKRVHLAYCRNMINGFDGDYVNPFNVQINIYNCIHEIVDHVNGWLDSFNSETIINDIPSLIDSYKGGGDFNAIVREAIEKKKSKPSAPSPEPDNPSPEPSTPSPEPSTPSGTENSIIPELEKMLNDGMKSMKEEMSDILLKEFRDKIEKATAVYMDGIKKAVVDTLDENKDKPNASTKKEEGKVEKGQDKQGEAEKEPEEKKQQEPKEQEIIIQAPVNAATCKKFSSLLSMSVDSKEYRDIFDTLSESQQRYLSLLRASMNKDNQYILAHKNDNSISSSDYNELLKLAKSLSASSKKGSSQKQKNVKKQQQQSVQQQAATATV